MTAPCPKCGRERPARVVTFRDGTKHIKVNCPQHPGVYAPRDEERQREQAKPAPERSLLDF